MITDRRTGWAALGLLLFFGGWLALAGLGVFDPKPIGVLVAERPLTTRTIAVANAPVVWLEETLPPGSYSLRLTAAFIEGDPESEFGLAIGAPDDYLSVVASPLGYTAVRRHRGMENHKLFPFQPWPHVRSGDVENEIWLDVMGQQVTVRLNRELLWRGDVEQLDAGVGLVGRTKRETAVVDYRTLLIYTEE